MKTHIHSDQYGSRKGSSPLYALIDMLHYWYTGTDKVSSIADVILIDYQKAFEHINHNIVLHKLNKMGVHESLVNWLATFLHK